MVLADGEVIIASYAWLPSSSDVVDYISARILDTNHHPPELVLVLVQSKFAMNAATKFLNSAASLLKSISINRTITINSNNQIESLEIVW